MKLFFAILLGIFIGSLATFFANRILFPLAGYLDVNLAVNKGSVGIAKGLVENNKRGICLYLIGVMKYDQKDLFTEIDIPGYLQDRFSLQKQNTDEAIVELENYMLSGGVNCS